VLHPHFKYMLALNSVFFNYKTRRFLWFQRK